MMDRACGAFLCMCVAACGSSAPEKQEQTAPSAPAPADLQPWLNANLDVKHCQMNVEEVISPDRVRMHVAFGGPLRVPGDRRTFSLEFHRDGGGWSCESDRDDVQGYECLRVKMQCPVPIVPLTDAELRSVDPARQAPRCVKKARAVIKRGAQCGRDMARYTPEKICAWFLVREHWPDTQAARSLDIYLDQGCGYLQAAIDDDRL